MGVALIALAGIALVMVVYFGIRFELGPRPVQHEVAPDSDVKFIDANGIKFGYIENGKGPLVLLFHGYPETARSWREIQARLSSEGYHVVVPFLRGYPPTSSPADGDYRGQVLGQDILALIDAFKVGTAIVVGHDWGASAAYIAATKKPEKIEKLVAISMPHPRGFEGAVKFFSLCSPLPLLPVALGAPNCLEPRFCSYSTALSKMRAELSTIGRGPRGNQIDPEETRSS